MTAQKFAQYATGDEAASTRLRLALEEAGFRVKSASNAAADIAVRYRTGSGDEADLAMLVATVVPEAVRIRDALPKVDIPAYRAAHG